MSTFSGALTIGTTPHNDAEISLPSNAGRRTIGGKTSDKLGFGASGKNLAQLKDRRDSSAGRPLPLLIRMQDAALYLGIKVCTVRNEIRRGRLGFVSVGSRGIRLTSDHLFKYVEMRQVEAAGHPHLLSSGHRTTICKTNERRFGERKQRLAVAQATSTLARDTFVRKSIQAAINKKEAK